MNRFSAGSRGARYHFSIAIALISVIPLLAIFYLGTSSHYDGIASGRFWILGACLMATMSGLAGYTILRRYPVSIVKLRGYLERIAEGEIPEKIDLANWEDDLVAIERCMDDMLDTLRTRVDATTHERRRLHGTLLPAEKRQCLDAMATGMAHDLNNHLTAILANAGLLIGSIPAESPAASQARQIEQVALQASKLADQVLIYSGKGKFLPESVNVSEIVEKAREALDADAAQKTKITYHVAGNLPCIVGDPAQIRRAVVSLVSNALDAITGVNRGGGISVSTGLETRELDSLPGVCLKEGATEAPYVYIDVQDDGCGIPEEVQARMFDPFFTTKLRRQGLGLAVVLGVARAHKGTIVAHSRSGHGSSFRLLLPCNRLSRP